MLIMSNEMFTQLPTVGSAQLSDIICAVQGYVSPTNPGLSVQETLQQVYNLFQSNVILFNAGNPNSFVAGQTYQLLWDTTDNILWICTTTGSATTAIWKTVIGIPTNGQILIGNTGNTPSLGTITAGTNISIANAAGSITISGTGFAGFAWTVVASSTQAMNPNAGYIMNNGASLVTLTLPAIAPAGSLIAIQGASSGGWSISQNAGQTINIGSVATTAGVGGSIASTNAHDSFLMVCTTANTNFACLGAPQSSGLTIV
jgi:hypothetical protein